MRKRLFFFSLVIFTLILLRPLPIFASVSSGEIRIASFADTRGRFAIASPSGGYASNVPPLPNLTTALHTQLLNSANFGPSGVVQCKTTFSKIMNTISPGSLVDPEGNLLVDVFFGNPINSYLSSEEAEELARFIHLGGVVYVSGNGFVSPWVYGRGHEYNPLFEKLGIDDRFDEESVWIEDLVRPSINPENSIITNGSFGTVNRMLVTTFRKFNTFSLSPVLFDPFSNEFSIHEGKIGKGYLVTSGNFDYVDGFITSSDLDHKVYYLNLFALGCRDDWRDNAKVLNVPSFKQGLKEYDDLKPLWENTAYDNAGSEDPLRLTCDTNGDGATMAECGCAVTSASMVAKYHGIDLAPDRSEINPETLNFFLKQDFAEEGSKGYYSGNIIWTSIPNFTAKAYEDLKEYFGNEWENYEQPKLDFEAKENFDPEKIKQYIDTDRPVILKVNGVWGQHWVVVKGYDQDTGRLIINDPARPDPIIGKYTYLDEHYEPVMNSSMVVYEKTYSDFRYLQLVTTAPDSLTITDENGNALSNLETSFDAFYGDATSEEGSTVSSEGVYFYTIKQPDDGNFKVTASAPFAIYSSDTEGKLTKLEVDPLGEEKEYLVPYIEETAGEQISIEEIVEERPQAIDIRPWTDYNWISRSGLLPVPVAILSTNSFDAMTINESSIRFGVSGTEKSLVFCLHTGIDVNDDNKLDKLCFFNQHKLKAKKDTTQMTLTADNFSASDIVTVIKHIGILDLF